MSKSKNIVGVDMDLRKDGVLWVWVVFNDSKDRSTNCVRDYRTRNPVHRARILRRVRQMQEIIIAGWGQ